MGMLDGKVAIVTGGGRGLGRAHCLTLAAAGATVVVNDIGAGLHGESSAESPADEVVKEITAAGGTATTDGTSVSDWSGVEELVRSTAKEFGRLDIVVNNAGIVRDRMLFSMSEEEFDAVIAVHLKGTFALTRHACAYWREQSKLGQPVSGRIVNTTSGTGLFGNAGQANYGAAKAGIVSLTQITAIEMARYNVTANAVSPLAATRMTQGIEKVAADSRSDGFNPRDPANTSGVVAYLASDAAGWLTGQVLRVDGDKVQRLTGWAIEGEYASASGEALTPEELVSAMPQMYGAAPLGRAYRRS
ncbi:SDR family NAD(P)-dependent oxidoreductase [Streptomyces brasiliensis]|uniref:Short-chain dehydrogenase n=1 Tax=Streptomyces brasiliensis TaxID=1954 RepID=A0A917UKB6_9ACTN|nr:SDR family NAD(P)-dependent oxidoreductase [Streptomyces brasiliensis]GGJ62799.1 short-chain dehydrogenase [Streptomyces brasiliensis]